MSYNTTIINFYNLQHPEIHGAKLDGSFLKKKNWINMP